MHKAETLAVKHLEEVRARCEAEDDGVEEEGDDRKDNNPEVGSEV